jgi:hypothetical protein
VCVILSEASLRICICVAVALEFVFAVSFVFCLSSFAADRGSAFCFFCFQLFASTHSLLHHALNPTKLVISTGAQRSGDIRFSTPVVKPPSSKNHFNKKPLRHRHPLRRANPESASSPRPGLHPMPRQHRRHPTCNSARLPPRHHPAHPHRRRPIRHNPCSLQTPSLTRITTVALSIKSEKKSNDPRTKIPSIQNPA